MIIHRAFIREVLHTSSAVSAILLAIFVVTRSVDFLRQAAEGDIPIDSVLLLVMLKMLTYLDILIPLALYISMLLVLGRWARDNELTALNAGGIGMPEFIKPVAVLCAVAGTMVAVFSIYLAPLAAAITHDKQHQLRHRSDVTGIVPGVFTETGAGAGVYFVEAYDQATKRFRNIFIYNDTDRQRVVFARTGFKTTQASNDFLILKNGTQTQGVAGTAEYRVMQFETYALRLKQGAPRSFALPIKAMPTNQLWQQPHRAAIGELHWRLSKVAMLPVLMLFALTFCWINHRKAGFHGLMSALLVYFVYSNMLGFSLAMIAKGALNPQVGVWIVHGIFGGIALYLFMRRYKNKPLLWRGT